MRKLLYAFVLFPLPLFGEAWISDYGYYENTNEISAKDRVSPQVNNIYDFEKSPNPGGESVQKGRYYIDTKYQGGYNGIDTDHVYLDEIAGQDGKDGANGTNGVAGKDGRDGKDADMSAVHDLQETKVTGQLSLRMYDHKWFSLSAYNTYDFRHRHNHELGMAITVKLGKSYEERRIESLEEKIRRLELLVGMQAQFLGR